MRLTRCYVPPPLAAGETRLLPEQVSTHVARVLRARAGEALTLFDGRGGEFDATIVELGRRGVSVRIDAHHAIERESPLRVTLLQALARAERMDLIVQKATELGVASIVAWSAGRSVVQLDGAGLARRCEHWRAVAISACEQCGRNQVPPIVAVNDLASACAHAATEAAGSAYLRLLLAPERVLEYVVWHEVCHLEILDHSPRFWRLVEQRWPDYREDRAWLSRHGATLVL